MDQLSTLRHYVQRLVTQPRAELSLGQRRLRYMVDLGRHCGRQLAQDDANQMAAALTYRTLFSLLPMIVLALVVLQAFHGMEEYQEQFKQTLVQFVLPKELLELPADAQQSPAIGESQTATPSQTAVLEDAQRRFGDEIQAKLDMLGTVNFSQIGWVGLLVFIYGATALLATVEHSFNAVYRVPQGRPWYLRLTYYYTVITLGPVVLLAGQVAQANFTNLIQSGAWSNWLTRPMTVVSPLVTTWIVLLAMYMLLPSTRVAMRAAAIGSFVAAVLWVISKEGFAVYVTQTTRSRSIYGALGLVPLFLLWIYVTWLIVLFGLELAYTLQTLQGRVLEEEQQRQQSLLAKAGLCDPANVVPMMVMIAASFRQGRAISEDDLAHELDLPARAVSLLVRQAEQQGLLLRVQGEEGLGSGLTLARPAELIPVRQLVDLAWNAMGRLPEDGDAQDREIDPIKAAVHRWFRDAYDAQLAALGDRQLSDLLAAPAAPSRRSSG